MKSLLSVVLIALFVGTLAGCNPKAEETETPAAPSRERERAETSAATPATGAPLGSLKVGDKAVCAVCAVKEGTAQPEEVKATLDYKGKTYAFCNLDEKAEFISNPSKYAGGGK